MIKFNVSLSQQSEFGMPISGHAAVASVRALPVMGGVSVVAVAKGRLEDVNAVCGYTRITDGAVVKGAFPGTSAWSPPI